MVQGGKVQLKCWQNTCLSNSAPRAEGRPSPYALRHTLLGPTGHRGCEEVALWEASWQGGFGISVVPEPPGLIHRAGSSSGLFSVRPCFWASMFLPARPSFS